MARCMHNIAASSRGRPASRVWERFASIRASTCSRRHRFELIGQERTPPRKHRVVALPAAFLVEQRAAVERIAEHAGAASRTRKWPGIPIGSTPHADAPPDLDDHDRETDRDPDAPFHDRVEERVLRVAVVVHVAPQSSGTEEVRAQSVERSVNAPVARSSSPASTASTSTGGRKTAATSTAPRSSGTSSPLTAATNSSRAPTPALYEPEPPQRWEMCDRRYAIGDERGASGNPGVRARTCSGESRDTLARRAAASARIAAAAAGIGVVVLGVTAVPASGALHGRPALDRLAQPRHRDPRRRPPRPGNSTR